MLLNTTMLLQSWLLFSLRYFKISWLYQVMLFTGRREVQAFLENKFKTITQLRMKEQFSLHWRLVFIHRVNMPIMRLWSYLELYSTSEKSTCAINSTWIVSKSHGFWCRQLRTDSDRENRGWYRRLVYENTWLKIQPSFEHCKHRAARRQQLRAKSLGMELPYIIYLTLLTRAEGRRNWSG